MSGVPLDTWARWQLSDLLLGGWETRHSLFIHYALYGAVLAALTVAAIALAGRARTWVVVVASVAGLALLGSGTMALFAVALSVALYLAVERLPGPVGIAVGVLLLLALTTYPALIPAHTLAGNPHHMREFWAFATNVWLLRAAAYLIDRRARATERRTLGEFLLATLFFPTFINGPIETTEQLAAHTRPGPAVETWDELRLYLRRAARMAGRFLWGIVKVLVATFYLGQDNDTIFATAGTAVSHPRLWLWAIELYFQFYIVFSGWTDVAIALAHVMGYEIAENFDRPWRSRSAAEFWRRWHISFGVWLRSYIYLPLGGNRRNASLNVLITFLVSGLWHVWGALKVLGFESYPPSAWLGFVVWGLLNGAAVVAQRWWTRSRSVAPLRDALSRTFSAALRLRAAQALAFGFVALAWVPFFLPPWVGVEACGRILLRMLYLA